MSVRLFLLLFGSSISSSACQCTWPTDFQSSTWRDSDKGDMIFGTTTMTGWEFNVQIQAGASLQTLNTWECVTYNETYLVMKTTETFVQFVTNVYTGYRCLRLTKLTESSYRYYESTPLHTNLGGVRLFINENSNLNSISDVCFGQFQASGSEFKVMIKAGFESTAKVFCPYSFLANHTFTYADSSTANTCDPVTDTGAIDFCLDNTELAYKAPSCVTTSFYSDADAVWCIDVVPVDTDIFVSLYNGQQDAGSIDATTYTSFSCIGINGDKTALSVTPNSCKPDQTATAVPVDVLGNNNGAVLTIISTDTACPPCPVLTDPVRGNVTIATSGAITTATYTCESTYTLSGDSVRVCQGNGTWSGSTPSCTCPVLSDPVNGTINTGQDGLTATYSCNVGTVLVGSVILTCNITTNTWDSSPSTCDSCQTLSSPENGSFSLSSDGLTTLVAYTCDVGTTLTGQQTGTCQTNGLWDNTGPVCTFCATLSKPNSGNVTIASNGSYSIATYVCVDGYSLQGSNTSLCDTSGVWDTPSPTCYCDSPLEPSNGTLEISSDHVTATYTCDIGTSLNGSSVRTCQIDGSGWSSSDPICVACPQITVSDNGTFSLTSNGTVTMASFRCDVGTSLTGNSVIYCLSNGTWSSSSPNCTQCQMIEEPSSGNYTFSTNGLTTTASVACDIGTTLSGDITLSCLENGTWSTSSTNVTCVSCPTLTSISAGLGTLASNGSTTTARFECAQGYGIVGDSTSTCQPDGTWSSATPTCVSTLSSESKSEANSLLPVLIVLAVLTTAFGIAFGIFLYLYCKSKRKNSSKSPGFASYDKNYDVLNSNLSQLNTSKRIPSSHPPMDHQKHVLSSDHLTGSRAPTSFGFKDSFGGSESFTPRSAVSSITLPLHLVREATTSSISEQPPAPWSQGDAVFSTPRTSGSVSNPRTPRKPKSSPRKPQNGNTVTSLQSLEESTGGKAEPNNTMNPFDDNNNKSDSKRRKKKKSFLVKANSLKDKANDINTENDDTDVPSVNINDELNSSRRLYASVYKLLQKQEDTLSSVLNKESDGRDRERNGKGTQINERHARTKIHSSSPSSRASTPVKHSLQVSDPQSCITPRSSTISTVQ